MRKPFALLLVVVLTAALSMVVAKSAVSSAESFENSWSTKMPMPEVAGGARAAVVDGKIHVIGGSVHYVYDPVAEDWTAKEPMPTAKQYFGIAIYQNKIYTIGGSFWDPTSENRFTVNVNEVYDVITQSWETMTPTPTNRSGLKASVVDGKIYLIGGAMEGVNYVDLNEVYDIATDSWETKNPCPYPVNDYASAVVDNKIYLIGGFPHVGHTQIFDSVTDSWSLGASLPESVRHAAAGATIGILAPKRIYVIGGVPVTGIHGINTTQVYDPETDSWSFGAQMPTTRGWLAVGVVNDLLYAIGGSPYLTGSFMATNEQYVPFGFGNPDASGKGASLEITLISPVNKTYHSARVSLEFSSNTPLSWMGYALSDGGVTEIAGNTTLAGLSLGSHSLIVYALDEAGVAGFSQVVCFTVEEAELAVSPVVVVAAVSIAVIVAGASVMFYFRKRRKNTGG